MYIDLMHDKVGTNNFTKTVFIYLLMLLISLDAFFSQPASVLFENPNVTNIFLVMGYITVFFLFVASSHNVKPVMYKFELIWLLFIALVLVRNWDIRYGDSGPVIAYILTVILMLLLIHSDYWFHPFINIVKLLCLIHALATIVFWIFPNLYHHYYFPAISYFIEIHHTAGHRTGLTSHFSRNAIYITVGLLAFSTNFSNDKKRFIDILFLAIFLFALLLTTKRAHLLFGIMAIVGAYFFSRKENVSTRFIKIISILSIVVIALFAIAPFVPELMTTIDRFFVGEGEDITTGRIILWEVAMDIFLSSPLTVLFGVGWGGFRHLIRQDIGLYIEFGGHQALDAHNSLINLLSEVGILGTAIVLSLLLHTLLLTIRIYDKRRKGLVQIMPKYEAPLFFSIAMQLFIILYSITASSIQMPVTFVPYAFSCAIAYAVKRRIIINRLEESLH